MMKPLLSLLTLALLSSCQGFSPAARPSSTARDADVLVAVSNTADFSACRADILAAGASIREESSAMLLLRVSLPAADALNGLECVAASLLAGSSEAATAGWRGLAIVRENVDFAACASQTVAAGAISIADMPLLKIVYFEIPLEKALGLTRLECVEALSPDQEAFITGVAGVTN